MALKQVKDVTFSQSFVTLFRAGEPNFAEYKLMIKSLPEDSEIRL
jgi:hypothetical protein